MKKIAVFAALSLLTGCGLSQSKFEDEFADKACEFATTCEQDCASGGEDSGGEEPECTFDKAKAKECLDAIDAVNETGTCEAADGEAFLDALTGPCADALDCA